ncbi:2-C-methyl-D-erythritol 4-phosphate cytidylyltransferase [Vacuolonema iberomarrocanum]|uniref:2-C-methyl-D-erythritol 4-phosphate cytidylyltransferase n=1 Tax=Vacuolonema iberomarrocanum TaxID=3454632 RepID=UPI001A0F31C7|nr:2-C-methyl-D-erythritol 4-phosphate cytidylyltransferase [filamentous cyanobacterium LEGE 07170]
MHLLIPAAGSGKRMGGDRNKLLLSLREKPLLAWTLLAANAAQSIQWVGVIAQPDEWEELKAIVSDLGLNRAVHFIPGGKTRQESVHNGLNGLPDTAEQVLIHDGARCLVSPALIDRCASAVHQYPGLIAAIPVKDTIKQVLPNTRQIQHTPDRQFLWAAQTPQGFDVTTLRKCHEEARRQRWAVTDDAALFEKCGLPVQIVEGEETNLKVTTPVDLAIADFILQQRHASNV